MLKRLIPGVLLTGLLLAACAPRAVAPALPTPTSQPHAFAPLVVPSATAAANAATPTEVVSSTPAPFVLNLTPVPTDTPLPTIEVPTEAVRAPTLLVWDGLPTYLADSDPDYYFRVSFDPNAWALTTDNYGFPALVHRAITNCIISPTAGRGLPPNATVDHETRTIHGVNYQVTTTSLNGVRQSVTYTGGDGRTNTAFQVSLDDRADQCLLEAETVLGTLTSVPISRATPIPTP